MLRLITWSPARAERETAFAFDFPESFPALPPACKMKQRENEKIPKRAELVEMKNL